MAGRDRSPPVDLDRIEVGPMRPAEIAEAIAVTARAMSDSPMAVGVIGPDPERCYRQLHRFFKAAGHPLLLLA